MELCGPWVPWPLWDCVEISNGSGVQGPGQPYQMFTYYFERDGNPLEMCVIFVTFESEFSWHLQPSLSIEEAFFKKYLTFSFCI